MYNKSRNENAQPFVTDNRGLTAPAADLMRHFSISFFLSLQLCVEVFGFSPF